MSLQLPRSRYILTFSDALIFLTILNYGGAAAAILAGLEMLANCLYMRWKDGIKFGKLMIPTNAATASLSVYLTFQIWSFIPRISNSEIIANDSKELILSLGVLAFTNFLIVSSYAAIFQSIKDGTNFWETWKRDCFSSSLSQLVGAGLAGIIFKLLNYGDLLTALIASVAISIAYYTYRQSINEINDAIKQAEEAEREKSETERKRRKEAEKHASQLIDSLKKEEQANDALRKSEKAFQYAALHDSLTNLANRQNFNDELKKLIDEYKEDPNSSFQVLFIDISKFKNINDSLGHTIGDKVLIIVAKRFLRMLRPDDVVARIGGDEFAIILRNLGTISKAQKIARKIYQNLAQPFSLSGNRIYIGVNIGIASCDVEYDSAEEILRDADIAMHFAKEKGIGVAVFTKELRSRFLERVRLESDLRYAIERNELVMNYQPLVSLETGQIIGFEALLRWHHGELGLIPPVKFIPLAEDSGLIVPITIWILQETCCQLAKWQKISPSFENLMMSVNISGKHLTNDELIDDVEQALEVSGIMPDSLKLEITESVAMENAEHTIEVLTRLKETGVKLSIDDFGTGYSSLNYLHRLPFDTLKIDRSFVYRVGENGENSEILQTIISLAKNLKMKVIAEGIETESQLQVLQNLGCDFGQGYLLSKPKPRDEAEKMLFEHKQLMPAEMIQNYKAENAQQLSENLPLF
ncbi:MAG TPA: EAL domain-containing protein [Pyrinomonadaceae bacterium]|nr:EAL domain-containing protein [Pyrinomonadaceae bacterium]